MRTWRSKVSTVFRSWQLLRIEVKQAKAARRDERQAEELHLAKEGLSQRPGGF